MADTSGLRLGILFAVVGVLLYQHMGAYAGSSDTSGYMNAARLLAAGEMHPRQRAITGVPPAALPDMSYVPLGFRPVAGDRMFPTYPLGLPVLLLLGSELVGWTAGAGLIMWLQAMGCLAAAYALFRELQLSRELSLFGVFLLGTSPLFFYVSLNPMTDTPATLWGVLTVLACLRAARQEGYAALAGALFAYGVLVRPTGLLMALPAALLLPWTGRRILAFAAGALPGMAALAVSNQLVYGHPLSSGYGNMSGFFGARYIAGSVRNYLHSLPRELTPLVLLAALLPFLEVRRGRRIQAGLWAWVLAFFGFYAFYYCTHETWWYLRFVLPAFPPLIALVLLALERGCRQWPRAMLVGGALLVAATGVWNGYWTRQWCALDIGYGERVYVDTCDYLRRELPPSAVILAMQESGAIFYYTPNVVMRWDTIRPEDFRTIATACQQAQRPLFLVLFPFEREAALQKFDRGRWQPAAMIRDVSVLRLAGLRPPAPSTD